MLSVIVAMSKNQVIGRNGGLPWRLRSDLMRFKKITLGHTLIMGRKTFESIGRVLPGRRTIVISRSMIAPHGVQVASSFAAALDLAHQDIEPFVVGGGEIYRLALPLADRLYLTCVEAEIEGEVTFPSIDFNQFQQIQREEISISDHDEFAHTFEVWQRLG
jgi:dihydrofolate reductase